MALLACSSRPVRDLITHTFRLDQAVEAYNLFAGGTTGKVVLTWE